MSQQPVLDEAKGVIAADDNVIEQRDIQQPAGALQLPGDLAIIGAGGRIARRMVVNSHDGGGIQVKGSPDDVPGKHGNAVESPFKHFLHGQDVVPWVEKDYGENFAIAEPAAKEALHVPRVSNEGAAMLSSAR